MGRIRKLHGTVGGIVLAFVRVAHFSFFLCMAEKMAS